MEQKQALEELFSPKSSAGTDLDEAANVLDGVEEPDFGVQLEETVKIRAREFLMDPAGFIASNPSDPRVAQWTRLAASLGVTIAPTAPSSLTATSAATPTPPASPAATSAPPPAATPPAPPPGLSVSDLRKALLASAAGPSLAGVRVATGTSAGKPPTAQTADPSGGGKPPPKDKEPKAVKKPAATSTSDGDAGTTTSEPPDDGHRSSAGDTGGHDRSSRQQQRRRDYALTFAEVARELAALVVEDVDALERRLAIETAADVERRRHELEIADEQRKRDAAAADEQRKRDEEAEERKRRADEEAEERKLRRKEEAEERKRLAELEREKTETEAARPRPSRVAAGVSLAVLETLRSAPYLASRDKALELARRAREGDASARVEYDALVASLRQDVRSMAPGYQVAASAELLLSLIESVEADRDQADPAWFKANFLTGSY